MSHRTTATVLLLSLLAGGCVTTFGSRSVPPARFNFNEAVTLSWNEQLLLNLVRTRYRDTTLFLEVTSILSQYSITGTGTLSVTAGLSTSSSDSATPGATLSYTETPTVTYSPLQGTEFVRRLLSPISAENLGLLAQSGWSIDTLLLCCAEQLNHLFNASSASGPTPGTAPRFEAFHRTGALLGELQTQGVIDIVTDSSGATYLEIDPKEKDRMADQVKELRQLLKLDASQDTYNIVWDSTSHKDDEVAIKGRSLFGVISFLSHGVEPPSEHEAQGLVTVTRDAAGQPFDWSKITGRLMRIHSSKEAPDGAYVRIRYRNRWFYIEDNDLYSKTTFALVTYLFALQSVQSNTATPAVTLSAGGS